MTKNSEKTSIKTNARNTQNNMVSEIKKQYENLLRTIIKTVAWGAVAAIFGGGAHWYSERALDVASRTNGGVWGGVLQGGESVGVAFESAQNAANTANTANSMSSVNTVNAMGTADLNVLTEFNDGVGAVSGESGGELDGANGLGGFGEDVRSDAERELAAAIIRLEELRSFSADVNFEARFFGERYFGRGRYEETTVPALALGSAQRRPLERTSFRLRASTARTSGVGTAAKDAKRAAANDDENVLEVVCDCERQSLWTYSSIERATSLSHINIEELSNVFARLDDEERKKLVENGVFQPCGASGLPGLGGLSGTLKRLGAIYRFAPNVENAEPIKGTEVVKITGTVAPEFWEKAKRTLEVDDVAPFLAENIPSNVDIYFGADWPFPYKIVYYSVSSNEEKIRNEIFCVEYESVSRNDASIQLDNFRYDQPPTNFDRANAAYLEDLIPGIRL